MPIRNAIIEAIAREVAREVVREHEARAHAGTDVGIREAAQALGVHENTVRNWANNGTIAARILPSGFRRIPRSEVARLQAKQDKAEGAKDGPEVRERPQEGGAR